MISLSSPVPHLGLSFLSPHSKSHSKRGHESQFFWLIHGDIFPRAIPRGPGSQGFQQQTLAGPRTLTVTNVPCWVGSSPQTPLTFIVTLLSRTPIPFFYHSSMSLTILSMRATAVPQASFRLIRRRLEYLVLFFQDVSSLRWKWIFFREG